MSESLQNIGIKQLKGMFPSEVGARLDDDFIFLDIRNYADTLEILKYPCRFDGYMAIFCMTGAVQVELDLNVYQLHEHTLLISTPSNIIHVNTLVSAPSDNIHFIVLALSKEYLTGIHFDFNKMFADRLNLFTDPCIQLNDENIDLCSDYLSLVNKITNSAFPNKKEAIGALVSSLFYLLTNLWHSQQPTQSAKDDTVSIRMKRLFEQFVILVTQYHTKQRNISFYADHIGLTPKYLSQLIKRTSGRSAPEWINSFVVLEAKNMLKYSDLTIKEIVARLNFPNQSVFNKFFKAHTGMTPNAYRVS